ncbi:hypothetical protein ACO0OL_000950 [Hanseniaspora opuntiae]
MLSLILGNMHVPYRAIDLPVKFKELLKKNQGKIAKIYICSSAEDPIMSMNTTNSELLQFLHDNVCPDIDLVGSSLLTHEEQKGKYEQSIGPKLHKSENGLKVYNINGFRVAFISQIPVVPKDDVLALINLSRQARSDVLIWGGKHEVEAYSLEGVLFLSPGTATGAFSIESNQETPDISAEENENIDEKEEVATEEDAECNENSDITNNEDGSQESVPLPQTETKKDEEKEELEITESLNIEPSFILLDIPKAKIEGEEITCTVYIYSLDSANEIVVDNIEFKKT